MGITGARMNGEERVLEVSIIYIPGLETTQAGIDKNAVDGGKRGYQKAQSEGNKKRTRYVQRKYPLRF